MLRLLFESSGNRRGRTYLLIVLAIACIGWAGYAAIDAYQSDAVIRLRLGAGSIVERRYQIAEYLAHEAPPTLQIDVVPATGFSDAIARISSGLLDAAVISSGLKVHDCDSIRILAGLDVAPLHILVRRELATSGSSLLELLRNRRINLGEVGTNDHELACEVMKFLRFTRTDDARAGEYIEVELSKDQLTSLADEVHLLTGDERARRVRELPDVIMLVASLPSNVVQHLLDTGEYTIVPFPYCDPFLMTDTSGVSDGLCRLYVEHATIPATMYLGNASLLGSDIPSIGMRNLLVARADLPEAAAHRLMQTVFETNFARRVKPLTPREIATTYEIHAGAASYLDGNKPLLTGKFFDSVSQGLSIFGAFSAGALSLYGYLRRRRIRRPGEYLDEIRNIDALATSRNAEPHTRKMPERLVEELDSRLIKIKEQLIQDYCGNRVQGELVLMSILSMLADSRAHLRRSTGPALSADASSPPPTPELTRRVA